MLTTIDEVKIANLQDKLVNHPIFQSITSVENLKVFMEDHVYAVWDFMSLTKRLQRELTVVTLPWIPLHNSYCTRFINEIVIGEESDLDANGTPISHLQLYLNAMNEVGADTTSFNLFLNQIKNHMPMSQAFVMSKVPQHVKSFVQYTLDISLNGSLSEVIGSFFFGRENIIPLMFEQLLKKWQIEPATVPSFYYYLKRHIELDTGEHGPAAKKVINSLLSDKIINLDLLYKSAYQSIQKRIFLWDGILKKINN